jgi:hypothetical protein
MLIGIILSMMAGSYASSERGDPLDRSRAPAADSDHIYGLATAHAHRHSLTAFCVYDRRLLEAAESQDLPTVSPRNGAFDH